MKKLLLSLFILMACVMSVNATETVFDFTKPTTWGYVAPATASTGTDLKVGDKMTTGDITIEITKIASTATRFWNYKGSFDLRSYAGATFKITSTKESITKMVFDGAAVADGSFIADNGSFTGATWEGSSKEINLTINKTIKVNTLTVTSGAAATVLSPTFSVKAGNYAKSQSVELACETAGASIYYTTDGTDPTASSTKYTAAITVDKTMTVKAIAINGSDKSSIATAVYTFPTDVADVASLQDVDDNTYVRFTSPVSAIYQSGYALFVKDAKNYMELYGTTDMKYKNGDVIPAGFCGVKTVFNGAVELKNIEELAAGTAGTAVDPVVANVDEITDADAGKFVVFNNVKFTKTANKISSNTDSLTIYNNFKITLPEIDDFYSVKGFISIYTSKNSVKTNEIMPVDFVLTSGINPVTADDNNLKTYDISGRKMVTPVRGQIYIKGKKKYIAK